MKTPQFELFHEDVYSALKTCIDALGGAKKVGPMLWGDSQLPNKLGEKLNNCLNPTHSQKLSLIEILFILRKANEVGCHAGINFICRDTNYSDPLPLNPDDELAQLQKDFIRSVAAQKQTLKRMERLAGTAMKAVS